MRVAVIGATGLLGHAAAVQLLARGHEPTLISRTPPRAPQPLVEGAERAHVDVWAASAEEVRAVLAGHDAVVYALGPDDRTAPPRPALDYFRRHLVDDCTRVLALAREAGVRRAVVLGSYFTAWARQRPDIDMVGHHPYVRARQEQLDAVLAMDSPTFATMVLEIPYVFGTVPGQVPTWKEWIFDRVRSSPVVLYPAGGTSAVTSTQVGEAIAGAVERGVGGTAYPLSDEELTWRSMLQTVVRAMGRRSPVVAVPWWLAEPEAWRMGLALARQGKDSGVSPRWVMRDIMRQHMYVDAPRSLAELGWTRGGVHEAIARTVHDSYR